MMEEAVITGIAHDTSEVKVTIRGVPDMTGVAAKVFSALAGNNVRVDMIIQNISEDGFTDISFTCAGADLALARETIERILPDINAREFDVDADIAKVSLVGTGMKSSPGVAARAFTTLGENQINILAISTSPIRLSVVVDGSQAAAGRALPAYRIRPGQRQRVRGDAALRRGDRREDEQGTLRLRRSAERRNGSTLRGAGARRLRAIPEAKRTQGTLRLRDPTNSAHPGPSR